MPVLPKPAALSPFQRLAALISGVAPARPAIDMSIGEPKHGVPDFVAPVLAAYIADFGRYPPIRGTVAFREAAASWLERRYKLATPVDRESGVLPLNGSREGLFYAAHQAMRLSQKPGRPVMLLPNPFYAVYAAAAEAAGAEAVLLSAGPETGFLPDLDAVDPAILARTVAVYYASPANPQGAVASLAAWQKLILAARQYGFYLFADECYSEIWRGEPAPGVLEACDRLGDGYGQVISFNSLSKRSNLPGLRCGIAAGDPAFLVPFASFRNIVAPQVPLPTQAVAVAAFGDEDHVIANRALYDAKFAVAEEHLGPSFGKVTPAGGFFLWLDVAALGGGETVTSRLWRDVGVKVIPGGYLAANGPDGHNPGANYIRIAMVDPLDLTKDAINRLAEVLT